MPERGLRPRNPASGVAARVRPARLAPAVGRGTKSPSEWLPSPSSAAAPAARTRAAVACAGAPTARTALWLRPRFIHDQVPIPEEAAVQHFDGFRRLFLGAHLDEPEAPRPPRELVGDDAHGLDRARLSKQLAQIFFCGLE